MPWAYRVGQPDQDHFNREFPAEGGTRGRRSPGSTRPPGAIVDINPREGVWDFRSPGPTASRSRSAGRPPASVDAWVADADGKNAAPVTKGFRDRGADHPRWLAD
ncbi:MAG: hypothetical protein U0790_21495 [Isosphaeraceae bacterium]